MRAEMLVPIEVACLRTNSITDFDMYLLREPDTQAVLYRNKCLPFTEEVRTRLQQGSVNTLYIESCEEGAYFRYLEDNLGALLSDPSIAADQKAQALYGTGRFLMREVLDSPRSGETVQRSQQFVEHTYDYLLSDRSAFSELLKITSYDYYTYTHSINVFVFSIALAQRVSESNPESIKEFGMGALLHDIGKSEIDPEILNSPGKLSEEQWVVMKKHPLYGCEILRGEHGLGDLALDVVRHHHEKLDGEGYPDQIKGLKISQFVRICTIADVFDALTTKRSYKDALGTFFALKTMKQEMADQLDPELFRTFVAMMGTSDN
jgi:HD-GYP domain-containing protein (c-di-GMP phosphodiesterase class II)